MSALSHVKTSPVADFTGTVTVFNSAGNTATANATDLIRPGDWNSAHNFFNTISGNTLGSSTAVGTNLVFGATGGISASHSTAAGAATMWISAPGTSSISATGQFSVFVNANTISMGVPARSTRSGWNPFNEVVGVTGQNLNGTLVVNPMYAPDVQFDRLVFFVHNSNSSNSSGSHTVSFHIGLYTKNGSTLSLLGSASRSMAATHSGTVGSYSLFSGLRMVTIGSTASLTEGEYWMGYLSRTSSAGANGSYSNWVGSYAQSGCSGLFGAATTNSFQMTLGQGALSTSTSAMPSSIAFSNLRGTDPYAQRQPIVMFASGTM